MSPSHSATVTLGLPGGAVCVNTNVCKCTVKRVGASTACNPRCWCWFNQLYHTFKCTPGHGVSTACLSFCKTSARLGLWCFHMAHSRWCWTKIQNTAVVFLCWDRHALCGASNSYLLSRILLFHTFVAVADMSKYM